jgi:hypothetical protein
VEQQFYTRNAMTGWVLVLGFLVVYVPLNPGILTLPQQCSTSGIGAEALLAVLIAVVGAPFIGSVVGAWGRLYADLRYGHTYHGESRTWLLGHIANTTPVALPPSDLMPPEGREDDLFALLFYARAPKEVAEFTRRHHTARFLGENWLTAYVTGLILGPLVHGFQRLADARPWWATVLTALLFLLFVPLPQFVVGKLAERDVECAERLWAWYTLHAPSSLRPDAAEGVSVPHVGQPPTP